MCASAFVYACVCCVYVCVSVCACVRTCVNELSLNLNCQASHASIITFFIKSIELNVKYFAKQIFLLILMYSSAGVLNYI